MPRRPPPLSVHAPATSVGLIALLTIVIIIGWTMPSTAGAQDDTPETTMRPNPELGIAHVSPVAVPFVGRAEIWCTDRNPSNGICGAHHGSPAVDIGMDIGSPIHASGAGTVLQVEAGCVASWCRGGAGLFVEIGHADGTTSRYLHLSQVLVEAGDELITGDPIGLSGNSGSARSPHLHYDEHFPRGTRTPFGPMLACVGGQVVQYPSVLGVASWNDVPFGTELVNEGYECLGGAVLRSPTPDILAGATRVAIRPPAAFGTIEAELEITESVAGRIATSIVAVPNRSVVWIDLVNGAEQTIRQRTRTENGWHDWSATRPLRGNATSEEPTCRGLFASSSVGTDRIDVLIGTDGDDTIHGRGGDDVICSGDGHDVVSGGAGDDWIDTGAGRDTVTGGDGRDRIMAGPGRDSIAGGGSRDRIIGGRGADEIVGGDGDDVLIGGAGDDTLRGDGGQDRIKGGRGDDTIAGGGGPDQLDGNDGVDLLDGGSGTDRCLGDDDSERCE